MPPREEIRAWLEVPKNRQHAQQAQVVQCLFTAKGQEKYMRSSPLTRTAPPQLVAPLCSQHGGVAVCAILRATEEWVQGSENQKAGGICKSHRSRQLGSFKRSLHVWDAEGTRMYVVADVSSLHVIKFVSLPASPLLIIRSWKHTEGAQPHLNPSYTDINYFLKDCKW